MKENNRLLNNIISGIQEKKGKNITVIDLKGISGVVCDFFVICEGNTPTQVAAVAESVEHVVKKRYQRKSHKSSRATNGRMDWDRLW